MKKVFCITGAVVTALCLVLTIGFSQEEVDSKGPCRADVEKFCKGVKPGQGRMWACLKSNENALSQACKDHMAEKRENAKGFMTACNADAKKFCKKIPRGKGRVVACLTSHKAELSDACKTYFKQN
jgi:hypothetical protein